MANLHLTDEELMTLQEVLESDIARLRLEVLHTDNREFRKALKHKEQILEKVFAMLQRRDIEPAIR